MHTINKRRSREVQKTAERLYYKFLASYVEVKHNEIHKEALALFNQAKQENPCVKDLMKTATYLKRVHPNKAIPRHYIRRKQKHSLSSQIQQRTTQMVLTIPLLSTTQPTCSSQPEVTTFPPPPPPEVSTQPEVTTFPPPPPPEVSTQPEVTTLQPPPLPEVSIQPEVTTQPEVSTLPVLSTEIYNDLLAELREDPELWRILNDFEDNAMDVIVGEDNSMDSLVADDIFGSEELTQLEKELEATFDNIV